AGSVGQIIGPPIAAGLLAIVSWQMTFIAFAVFILLTLFVVSFVNAPDLTAPDGNGHDTATSNISRQHNNESIGNVVKTAIKDPTFIFLFIGFFSCGYQLAFITAHFPALIIEMCSAISPSSLIQSLGVSSMSGLGALAIAVIGAFNIGGTILAGWLGNHFSRKYLLAIIYLLRTVISVFFIMNPITPESVVLFSAIMGALWLATVPLTAGLVGQIYGLKYMGTLYGIVFFSHQLGGFLGVWLGGALYDYYGDYIIVWWVGIAVGALSAAIHLPVNETPYNKRQISPA
ncbi:MAG: MFS transporter, partial [Pseudomonadota bacterium]